MSYIRNPVYIFTGATPPFDDRDIICVSLPRGKNRNEPSGCDFLRSELLTTALAFLSQDYPEYVTQAGEDELKKIERSAEKERSDAWGGPMAKRLEKILELPKESVLMFLRMNLNPADYGDDMFGDDNE